MLNICHGETRHFFSDTADITLAFIGLVFFNGLADGNFGGSLRLFGSTYIFEGSLFYNNLASSAGLAVSII